MRRVLLRAKLPYHIAIYAANKTADNSIDFAVKLALERYGYDCMYDQSEIFDATLIAFKRYEHTNFADCFVIVKRYNEESISVNNTAVQIPNGDYDGFIKNQRIMYSEI